MKRFVKFSVVALCAAVTLSPSVSNADEGKDIVTTAVEAGSFKTLAAALGAADLVGTLQGDGPFTVFAPTDEAFAKLPKGTVETLLKPENKADLAAVLTYHVVAGKVAAADVVKLTGATTVQGQRVDIGSENGVTVDGAKVVTADIMCSNGIIHVIDSVILPAADDLATTATKAGSFGTLVAAAKAAGLVPALTGSDALTVFAPTDEAFAKLPAGTVESLLKPENKGKLADILKYHVVAGRVYSTDALKAGSAATLQGSKVTIAVKDGAAMVNDAKLITTDIDASNGVIHVIDSVILPPEKQAAAKPAAASPLHLLTQTVNQGSQLFNAGHHQECAKMYMTTAQQVLSMENHGMCQSTAHTLTSALESAEHTTCPTSRAWTMRRALDSAMANLR